MIAIFFVLYYSCYKLIKNNENVFLRDPFSTLCKGEQCYAFEDGKPLYFDGEHLSGYANRKLIPSFVKLIVNHTKHIN